MSLPLKSPANEFPGHHPGEITHVSAHGESELSVNSDPWCSGRAGHGNMLSEVKAQSKDGDGRVCCMGHNGMQRESLGKGALIWWHHYRMQTGGNGRRIEAKGGG